MEIWKSEVLVLSLISRVLGVLEVVEYLGKGSVEFEKMVEELNGCVE